MSNSSLSKTFVLGSLESLKFRSSVLSPQRLFSLKLILGRKKFRSEKFLVPRDILGLKNWTEKCWPIEILGLKKIRIKKILGVQTIFFVNTTYVSKIDFLYDHLL